MALSKPTRPLLQWPRLVWTTFPQLLTSLKSIPTSPIRFAACNSPYRWRFERYDNKRAQRSYTSNTNAHTTYLCLNERFEIPLPKIATHSTHTHCSPCPIYSNTHKHNTHSNSVHTQRHITHSNRICARRGVCIWRPPGNPTVYHSMQYTFNHQPSHPQQYKAKSFVNRRRALRHTRI